MYATIIITGQPQGNIEILHILPAYDDKKEGPFNTFYLYYKNASVAQKDLNQAYKSLKAEEPKTSLIQIYRSAGNKPIKLQYDASRAVINRTNQ